MGTLGSASPCHQPILTQITPHKTALMSKCFFLSELSLSASTWDGEFQAVQLKVGSASLCCVQLTLRRSLWCSWEWILDQA